jgi:NhaP-type Na+/H+ or K+/H+ antiporter
VTNFALILALGIGAQWLAWRLKLPSILLLLLFGFVAGPVTHVIHFDPSDSETILAIVTVSVGLILFEGGMSLRVSDLKTSGSVVWRLVSVGVLITGAVITLAARYVAGTSWPISALAGALLVVTGPTVIGPLLRHVRPTGTVGSMLRWEGIVIDPIGALCAVIVFEAFEVSGHSGGATVVALGALKTVGGGIVFGAAAAGIVTMLLRHYWIPDFLHNPVTLMMVVAALVGSNSIQPEAGLFTVTVMGILLANQKWVSVDHIAEFKETLSVLLISCLFILLSARLELSQFAELSWRAMAFLLVVILVARPLAVAVATYGSTLKANERIFLAAMAPRGIVAAAVSSVFALRLRADHFPDAEKLVPLVFLVIVGTVFFYSMTAARLGVWLGVAKPNAQGVLLVGAHALAYAIGPVLKEAGHAVLIVDTNRAAIARARLQGLETFNGSIIAPHVEEQLDLSGIGRMFALTPNDEVNALACVRFAKVLGRSQVYQLAPSRRDADARQPRAGSEMSDQLRGRQLFFAGCTLSDLEMRLAEGAVVKKTLLTDVFDLAAFRATHPKGIPMFLLNPNGELLVVTEDLPQVPRAGQTVVSLTEPTTAASTESAARNAERGLEPAVSGA